MPEVQHTRPGRAPAPRLLGFSLALTGLLVLGLLVAAGLGAVRGTAEPVRPSDAGFYLFAGVAVSGAFSCAFSRNILYSAWSLLFALCGVAGLYVFLGADFAAVVQVLLYIGGVLVLILFAVMLTRQLGQDPQLTNEQVSLPAGAALAAAVLGLLAFVALRTPWPAHAEPESRPVTAALGQAFLGAWLFPFELASVVLLAALVGAVVLARKEIKEPRRQPKDAP